MSLPVRLRDLIDFDDATLRVTSRESTRREFKQGFDRADLPSYARTLVGFSNNAGGVILFGISNKPRTIVGINPNEVADEAQWVDCLRTHFDPAIEFEVRSYQVAGRHICVVSVEACDNRPVLCRKTLTKRAAAADGKNRDITVLQEGFVYYRYAAQTRPIAHAEMAAILEDRDSRRMRALMQNLKIMQMVGFDRIGVVDATLVGKPGEPTKLYVSRETARHLNFVDRGRFVEEDGAPAYVVIGTVQLNQVIREPLPEEDKNLPEEAAAIIRPLLKKIFGFDLKFNGYNLAKLAAHVGIRKDGVCNPAYCVEEKKLKRVFYTCAGIEYVIDQLQADPLGCLRSFGSRHVVQQYQDNYQNDRVH